MTFELQNLVDELKIYRHGIQRHMSVFSHTSRGERLALYQLASILPPNARALEIGSHIGSSALFICAGLARVHGHLICVDTWMNETMPDGAKDTFAEFQANTAPYRSMITQIRKMSGEITDADIGGPLDFAFIDGDHGEVAVREDFRRVAPWVKVGGYIAFHDLDPLFPGVSIVFGEALASGSWQIVRIVRSLAVLRRVS